MLSIIITFHRDMQWAFARGTTAFYWTVSLGWITVTMPRMAVEEMLAQVREYHEEGQEEYEARIQRMQVEIDVLHEALRVLEEGVCK